MAWTRRNKAILPSNIILLIAKLNRSLVMEGYLELWQGFFGRWSPAYFRLQDELLLYGSDMEDVQGRIHLRVAQVISKPDDPLAFLLHTGTETLHLRAHSIDERVKWFRKLKESQKEAAQSSQNKQLFRMKMELSDVNRFRILNDLNTELWRCHAELQQRLQEVLTKIRNLIVNKNVDRLRIAADQFKHKTAQMLHYIDQHLRDIRNPQPSVFDSRKKTISETSKQQFREMTPVQNQDDLFYSFREDKGLVTKPKIKNRDNLSCISEQHSLNSLSSLELELKQKKSMFGSPLPNKKHSRVQSMRDLQDNRLKEKLIKENPVYLKMITPYSKSELRRQLPEKFVSEEKFPLTGAVSAVAFGGDLSRTSIPVTANEPLSALQRCCEQMYYCDLLCKADSSQDQCLRMLYVSAFAVSICSLVDMRTKLPFVPLSGETFEYIDQARGYQFLGEQVSQNPPISACYVRSDNYQLYDNNKSNISFRGNSIKIVPASKTVVKLEQQNDFYVIQKCSSAVSNLLVGKTTVELTGKMTITCKDYATSVTIQFLEDSLWKNGQSGKIKGQLKNQGRSVYELQGEWKKELVAINLQTNERIVLWKRTHSILEEYYNFNDFTLQLNNLTSSTARRLPPTDTRFRPDQKALEYRWIDLASEEKARLEQKQRKRTVNPLWLNPGGLHGEPSFISNQKYWDQKVKGSWRDCPDIF